MAKIVYSNCKDKNTVPVGSPDAAERCQ